MEAIAGYESDVESTQTVDADDIQATQKQESDTDSVKTHKQFPSGESPTQLVLSRSVSPITPRVGSTQTDAQASAHIQDEVDIPPTIHMPDIHVEQQQRSGRRFRNAPPATPQPKSTRG